MNFKDWINWLDSVDARYSVDESYGFKMIYVYSKSEYDESKSNPKEDTYVPYIRLSHFEWYDYSVYTRWNGVTGIKTCSSVKDIIINGI